jgi:hypothetical protein
MGPEHDSSRKGFGAAIVAIVFTVLAVATTTYSAYLAGLWTAAAMAWVLPFFVGGFLALLLMTVAMIGASFAIGETRTRRVGIAVLILGAIGLVGGVYGGCRKGWHDLRCRENCPTFW